MKNEEGRMKNFYTQAADFYFFILNS